LSLCEYSLALQFEKKEKKHEKSPPDDALDAVDAGVAVVVENFSAIIIS
jgi:hypothetical protein